MTQAYQPTYINDWSSFAGLLGTPSVPTQPTRVSDWSAFSGISGTPTGPTPMSGTSEYDRLRALINPSNAYTVNQQVGGGSEGYTSVPTTVPGAYLMDPSNPMAGYVWDGGGGALSSVIPRDSGGVDWTQYAPGGAVTGQGFDQDTRTWQDSLLGAVGTLGGAALLGNAGALLGGPAAPAAQAAAPAAVGSSMSPAIGAAAAGAGAAETLPALAGGAGAVGAAGAGAAAAGGASDWMSLLSNGGALAAGAGALAGIAGNSDMTNTSTSTQGLAPWMQPYAQDYLQRAQGLLNQPMNSMVNSGNAQMMQIAQQGDTTVNAGRTQQQNVIGGAMLNSNPYIDQVAGNIGRRMGDAYAVGTRAGQMGAASQSGNWDSAGAQEALGMRDRNFADSLGSTMSNLYMGNYSQERAAQDAAARGSLAFGADQRANTQGLLNAGWTQQQFPMQQLQNYGQAINPAFGSQGTQSQTINAPNNWMAGLGGAALGAGMYRSIFPQRG